MATLRTLYGIPVSILLDPVSLAGGSVSGVATAVPVAKEMSKENCENHIIGQLHNIDIS